MPCLYANNVVATLSIAVGTIDTVLQLSPGHGVGFPTISLDEWFYVTLVDPATGAVEVCRVNGRMGDTLVVARGADGTHPRPWPSGTVIEMRLTAQMLRELQDTGVDVNEFLRRAGGDVFGAVRWLENATSSTGWTQGVIAGGDALIDHPSPERIFYLYPRAADGAGRVIVSRLQYTMPLRVEPRTSFDLASGPVGFAAFLVAYNNAAAGTLRLVSGVGNTAWRAGDFFSVMWYGAGAPTVTAGPGVTIHAPAGMVLRPRVRYSVITMTAISQVEWVASGDLAEAT